MTMHDLSRRHFCTIAGCTALAAMAGPAFAIRRQDEALTMTRLRDGVHLIMGGGGNTVVIDSPDGPIVIDTKVSDVATLLPDRIREALGTNDAPLTIINTHHHYDHIGGNFAFGRDAKHLDVLAHRNITPRIGPTLESRVRPALRSRAQSAGDTTRGTLIDLLEALTERDFAPTIAFASELVLDRERARLTLRHHGPGHTDNDTVIYDETSNVLHVGDLIFNDLHPFIDRPGGANTTGWRASLRRCSEFCDRETIVVPGHGEVGDRRIIDAMITYFDDLEDIVLKARDEGRMRNDITTLTPVEFTDRGFERLQSIALGAMFDEIEER